jgi:hypothetical protein
MCGIGGGRGFSGTKLCGSVWSHYQPKLKRYGVLPQIEKAWVALYKYENMRSALHQWSKQQFGAFTDELNKLRFELDEVKARPSASRADIRAISDRMDEVLYHEEMMWLQRSRITWLKEGD